MNKIFILFVFSFLLGCGSAEKFKSKTHKKSKTELDSSGSSSKKTLSIKDNFTLEPFDPSKPMIYGRDTIYNTRIINNKEYTTVVVKDTSSVFRDHSEDMDVDLKDKKTDNTLLYSIVILGSVFLLFLFLLIVILLRTKKPAMN